MKSRTIAGESPILITEKVSSFQARNKSETQQASAPFPHSSHALYVELNVLTA